MRKYILSLVALLGLTSVGHTAFGIFQTYYVPIVPQITCNVATGVASVNGPCASPVATCNGDKAIVTRTVTMVTSPSPNNKNLNTSVNTFTSGDVGKLIYVPGAATGPSTLKAIITAFVDAQNVTLSIAATVAVTAVSMDLVYGHDDRPSFASFRTWALANQGSTNQTVLTIPASSNCWFGTQDGGGLVTFTKGIKNLLVEGNNSIFNDQDGDGGIYVGSSEGALCGVPLTSGSGCAANIQTAMAGASTVTLTAASFAAGYASRFAVGYWILVGGLNPQSAFSGGSGYPTSLTYFEWRQITAKCDNTVGCVGSTILTLDRPLEYNYLDTWPAFANGTDAYPGGPASIFTGNVPASDAWNVTIEFKDLTFESRGQMNGNGRYVTYRNVSFVGSDPQGGTQNCGPFPSMNEVWSAINVDFGPCTIEVDKIVTHMVLDTVTARRIDNQSSSVQLFTANNINVIGVGMIGTARYNNFTDLTTTLLRFGSNNYGNSTQTICTRCNVTTFDGDGGINNSAISGGGYTKSGSVFQFTNSTNTASNLLSRIFAPVGMQNSNLMYIVGGSFGGSIGIMNVSALTQDATNTYAQTGDSVAWPPPFTSGSGVACCNSIRAHPAPQFTCDACTGDPIFVGTNIQTGATPLAPLGEYGQRTYTPSASAGNAGKLFVFGRISSLTINVTVASTHSGAITVTPTQQFGLETVKQSDWTPFTWTPVINLKVAGTRVFTPGGGWTCDTGGGPVAGGCSGDTVTGAGLPPEAVWIKSGGGLQPLVSGGFTGGVNPTFTITAQTDQGVVP